MASEATPTNTTEVNVDAPSNIHTPTATTPTAQQQPQAGISDFISDASSTTQVRPGGAPARFYLNDKVVPYLLEGMKTIARDQYVSGPNCGWQLSTILELFAKTCTMSAGFASADQQVTNCSSGADHRILYACWEST